jgi:RNA polymerase sigma-70 factor (ECF subfamily)
VLAGFPQRWAAPPVRRSVTGNPSRRASSTDTDEQVVTRVLGGEREAFRLLVERHQGVVFRLVTQLGRGRSGAEDLAQEAFLAAFNALATFDPERGRFSTWLYAIARHRALNAAQKSCPIPMSEPPAGPTTRTPLDTALHRELGLRIEQALAALPGEQRQTFVLKELVGLETDEIAALDGVEPGTVRARLSRARDHLRAALREER